MLMAEQLPKIILKTYKPKMKRDPSNNKNYGDAKKNENIIKWEFLKKWELEEMIDAIAKQDVTQSIFFP